MSSVKYFFWRLIFFEYYGSSSGINTVLTDHPRADAVQLSKIFFRYLPEKRQAQQSAGRCGYYAAYIQYFPMIPNAT